MVVAAGQLRGISGPFHHSTMAKTLATVKTTKTISNMGHSREGIEFRDWSLFEVSARLVSAPRMSLAAEGGCAARLRGGCVSSGRRRRTRWHEDATVMVVERVHAVGTATTRILAGGQRREVPISAVVAARFRHQAASTDGARDRSAHVARRKESGNGRIAHEASLCLRPLQVSGGVVALWLRTGCGGR